MKSIRLQGKNFHLIKNTLTPVSYFTSDEGHVRINYKLNGTKYHHWLNDEESKLFNKDSLPIAVYKDKKENKK